MDARVDDQTAGTSHFVTEPTEVLIRRAVDPHLDTEFFRIKPPAFAEALKYRFFLNSGTPSISADNAA